MICIINIFISWHLQPQTDQSETRLESTKVASDRHQSVLHLQKEEQRIALDNWCKLTKRTEQLITVTTMQM